MIDKVAGLMRPVLEFPLIRRVRRNHALEHATAHMLARRVPNLRLSGRASDSGFVLFCDVPQDVMEEAAHEALRRMQSGESRWAVHPNCGTNLVTASLLTTVSGVLGLGGSRPISGDKLSRTMVLMLFAVVFSRPLGMSLQKHITTKGEPGDLEIISVRRYDVPLGFINKKLVMYRINTRRG